jgi:hypothetical protein
VTNDNANHRRGRGAWLGLLVVLLLALCGVAYAVSTSPSASTGKGKPSATPTADVLAPNGPSSTSTSSSAGAPGGSSSGATGTQVVLAPAASNGGGNGNCVEPSNGTGNCAKSFGVAVGQAQTLYPGLVRSLPVTYSNPNNFDILVTTYRVSVSVPSSQSSSCPASSLQVPSGTVTLNPQLTAPKNGSVATTIPIKLSPGAPDGCQSVTFTITVNATAVKK